MFAAMRRGFARHCPRCGRGKLFKGWYDLKDRCEVCELQFEAEDGSTWGFMYVSTGFITGVLIVLMFLVRPDSFFSGQMAMVAVALVAIVGSLPRRKGVAVAVEYWFGANRIRMDADRDEPISIEDTEK